MLPITKELHFKQQTGTKSELLFLLPLCLLVCSTLLATLLVFQISHNRSFESSSLENVPPEELPLPAAWLGAELDGIRWAAVVQGCPAAQVLQPEKGPCQHQAQKSQRQANVDVSA